MLKLFEKAQPSGGADPATYLFHFNSTGDPRAEANAVRDVLSRLIADLRTQDPGVPQASKARQAEADSASNGEAGGLSAAMSFASAVNSRKTATNWFDDDQLKMDVALQLSLMKQDKDLQQVYLDARQTKPETVSDASFNLQFWSTRVDVLRAHAIDSSQKKGSYNVLSTVKPRTVDGEMKLNISVEQVQLIFQQHPLVKRIYDESVPKKLNETEFWSRFFLSRLSKRLRGERVTENEASDGLFDKYNPEEDTAAFASKIMAQQHVPHIIDLEGNEENQGGVKSGNRKDVEMRPRARVPIMQTLNSLSEKIMADVAPSDRDLDTATGADDTTFSEQLALRDLQGPAEQYRIVLNAREQTQFFSDQGGKVVGSEVLDGGTQPAQEVLFEVSADLEMLEDDGAGGIDLHKSIGVDNSSDSNGDSDSDEQGSASRPRHASTRIARREAQSQILDGFARKRAEMYGHDSDSTSPMGIPPTLAKRCYLTNATTTEFLSQFWKALLSGDPSRAQELAYHAESLKRSTQRIEAIAAEAEELRQQTIQQKRQEILDHYKRTNRKIKWKPDSVQGGRSAVLALLAPTVTGLKYALELYTKALEAEGVNATPHS
jgi:transcription initiation factor TFIIH subunit 1